MPAPAPSNKYWFILGRETQISAAEIVAVLNTKKYEIVNSVFKTESTISNPKDLIKKLGGTIKIAKEMAHQIKEQDIEDLILEELKTVSGKINFGISIYTNERNDFADLKMAENFGKEIKKTLKTEGLSVRYVENREPVLSSVTVEKNNLTGRGREFIIHKQGLIFSLAKTEAVQPFEEFSARDFGRPGRDDVSGMLPPKLAMMMINLSQAPTTTTLLDPFCGSGTILSEALLLGYTNLVGTDISDKATSDTRENMAWVANRFKILLNQKIGVDTPRLGGEDPQVRGGLADLNTTDQPTPDLPKRGIDCFVIQKDIENLTDIIPPNSIDTIVTEPYMGRPLKGNEKPEDLTKQAGELKNLYLQAFSKFHKILKPKGRVIFLIPRFKYQNDWIRIDCQKEIQQLGFKLINFFEDTIPLVYARPNQRVAREIWGFEKK